MGLMSFFTLHLCYIDSVIFLMSADPLDPRDFLLEIDRHHQSIRIPFDVEDHAISGNDTCCRVAAFHVRHVSPARALHIVKPCIQCGLHRVPILMTRQRIHESMERTAGDNSHRPYYHVPNLGTSYEQSLFEGKFST